MKENYFTGKNTFETVKASRVNNNVLMREVIPNITKSKKAATSISKESTIVH